MLRRRERLTKDRGDRAREMLRPLEERLTAQVAEDRPPESIHGDRDDGHIGAAGNQLETPLQRQDTAVACQAALGKDADELTGLERLGGLLDRLLRLVFGDGDGPHQPGQLADDWIALEPLPGKETDRPRRQHPEQDHIDVGDVVADDQGAARRRQVGQTTHLHPVEEPHKTTAKRLHEAIPPAHGGIAAETAPKEKQQKEANR